MLQFKDGVRLNLQSRAIVSILTTLSELSDEDGLTIVITSGNDGRHMTNSRHYSDEAIDIRTKGYTTTAKRQLRWRIEARLGEYYRAILEDEGGTNEHIHIQVKKGRKLPEL